MTLKDVEKDFIHEVWPDCWDVVHLFVEMQTQWRVGMSGATGLDYGPLFVRMSHLALDWEQTFDDIRILEAAALEQMRRDRG